VRLLLLGLRNLRRNPRRTFLTALSLAVSLFLFVTLAAILVALDHAVESAGRRAIVVTTHRGGFSHDLPESHGARIRALPGVRNVVAMLYYGGVVAASGGAQDSFPSMACDTVPALRTMWGSDLEVSDADWDAWFADRTAVLVGPQLVRRFGWRRGQRITLRGTIRQVDLTFTVAGTTALNTDQGNFLLHREYLEEALGRPGLATFFWVEATSPEVMPALMARIDRDFEGSPDPTKTVTQKQILLSFIGMLGDVRGIVGGIALLVMVAVLFITVNSVALSARERTTEVAILKAIGFTGGDVLGSMVFEGLVVALAGGAAGVLAAWVVFRTWALGLGFGPLSGFQVSPTALCGASADTSSAFASTASRSASGAA